MRSTSRIMVSRLVLAAVCATLSIPALHAQQLSVRHVQVLGGKNAVEIEIEASDRVTPQTQVLTNPDRLVIDFPNAVPGSELRSQSVYRGQVKDLRVGLFQSKPPVTRIVLDLNSPQSYQIFPGQTVMIKVMSAPDSIQTVADYPEPTGRSGLITANYVTSAERVHAAPPPAPKPLEVTFRDGLLTIHSNKATLSEVLYAVQQRTSAEVAIASGAEQEKVVVDLGPAPAPEVLAQLLNGSKFNFLILSNANDPHQLDKVILSQRVEGYTPPPPPPMVMPADTADEEQAAPPPPAPRPAPVQTMPARMQGPGQPPQLPPDANAGENPQ